MVSILVLMDLAFESEDFKTLTAADLNVSILVLMDLAFEFREPNR